MASELLPCAHCGGVADLDYEQPFCAFPSGTLEKQVAIYCTVCDVHMSMCYSDFPEYDHDQMAAILTEKWNTRPAPAATDTGLETVSVELTPSGHPYMKSDPEGDYVTRSQAEELLAGRDAVIEMQADSIDKLERKVQHWQERADKAGELLAAEIELKQHWKDEAERFRIEFEKVAYDCRLSQVRVEALEAKLAAYEKSGARHD